MMGLTSIAFALEAGCCELVCGCRGQFQSANLRSVPARSGATSWWAADNPHNAQLRGALVWCPGESGDQSVSCVEI